MLTQIRRTIEEVHWIDLNQDLQSIDIRPNQYQPLVCLPRVPTTGRPSLTRFAARGILGIQLVSRPQTGTSLPRKATCLTTAQARSSGVQTHSAHDSNNQGRPKFPNHRIIECFLCFLPLPLLLPFLKENNSTFGGLDLFGRILPPFEPPFGSSGQDLSRPFFRLCASRICSIGSFLRLAL